MKTGFRPAVSILQQVRTLSAILTLAASVWVCARLALPAAAQSIEWTDQFGGIAPLPDTGRAVAADEAGNIYIAGSVEGSLPEQTSAGASDAFLRRYDSAGNELWTRQFGTGGSDHALAVAIDATGAVYVAGDTTGTFPAQTSAGGRDAFVRKYDSAGNAVWTIQFGTPQDDEARAITANGCGIFVAGITVPEFGPGTEDDRSNGYLRRIDSSGATLWEQPVATDLSDEVRAAASDATGVYVVGSTEGAFPGQVQSSGFLDAFIRKYDCDGAVLWTSQFAGEAPGGPSSAFGVATDGSAVYVGGYVAGALPGQTGHGGLDAFLRKYDTTGAVSWTRQFGRSPGYTVVSAVAISSGAIYLAGEVSDTPPYQPTFPFGWGDAFLRCYDGAGNELWAQQFGAVTPDVAFGVAASSSCISVVGTTGGENASGYGTEFEAGVQEVFVRGFNSSGVELWYREFGTLGLQGLIDIGSDIALDVNGNRYVVGDVSLTLPGFPFVRTGHVLRKYDPAGSEVWTRVLYNAGAGGVAVDSTGIYVAGGTNATLPGQNVAGTGHGFLRKYNFDGTDLWTRQFEAHGVGRVSVDPSGVYVVGSIQTGVFPISNGPTTEVTLRKFDLNGNPVGVQQFGAPATHNLGNSVAAGPFGILVGAQVNWELGDRHYDGEVRLYDTSGNLLWARQIATPGDNVVITGVAQDLSGLYVAGASNGALPGQVNAGGFDVFVRKYGFDGSEIWTQQVGSASNENAFDLTANAHGVFLAGYTFGVLPGQVSAGASDAFVWKLSCGGAQQWIYQFGTSGADILLGLAADATTGLHGTGTTSGLFPGHTDTTPESQGDQDVFVVRLYWDAPFLTSRERWRYDHFGCPDNTGAAADSEDTDGDGWSNYEEYNTGGDPTRPDGGPSEGATRSADRTRVEYTYTRSVAALAEVRFDVELATDLAAAPWSIAEGETILSDNGITQRVQVSIPVAAETQVFVRLRMTTLPPP